MIGFGTKSIAPNVCLFSSVSAALNRFDDFCVTYSCFLFEMTTRSLLSAILISWQVILAHSFSHGHYKHHKRQSADKTLLVEDVFEPMSYDPPPPSILSRNDHPQPPVGVHQEGPLQTNKFYANFFSNNQDNRTWTYPYSVWWPGKNSSLGHGLSSGFPSLSVGVKYVLEY